MLFPSIRGGDGPKCLSSLPFVPGPWCENVLLVHGDVYGWGPTGLRVHASRRCAVLGWVEAFKCKFRLVGGG